MKVFFNLKVCLLVCVFVIFISAVGCNDKINSNNIRVICHVCDKPIILPIKVRNAFVGPKGYNFNSAKNLKELKNIVEQLDGKWESEIIDEKWLFLGIEEDNHFHFALIADLNALGVEKNFGYKYHFFSPYSGIDLKNIIPVPFHYFSGESAKIYNDIIINDGLKIRFEYRTGKPFSFYTFV